MRRVQLLIIGICIGVFAGKARLQAQGCCSGGVPISGNLALPAGNAGSWQFMLTYDYNRLRDLYQGTERLDDDTRLRVTHSWLLESSYGFSDRFTVSGLFSFVRQERRITALAGREDFTANNGPGDLILLARYNLFKPEKVRNTEIVLGLGPKVPLGRTDYTDNRGLLLPPDLQPGTGAWDAVLWSFFAQRNLLRPTMGFTAIPTLRITGTNQRYNDSQSYRFGNEFQTIFGFSDRFTFRTIFLDPQLMFRFRTTSPDLAEGETFPNTGGTWLHILPGFNLGLSPNVNFRFNAEIPLYRRLTGTQLTTSYKLTAALYVHLPNRKPQPLIPY